MVCLLACAWGNAEAQGVDNQCPEGWKPVVEQFLAAESDRDVLASSQAVLPSQREVWKEWKAWEWTRAAQRLSQMPEDVQSRAKAERMKARERLTVSNFSCRIQTSGADTTYLVQVDPDGRSYRHVRTAREGWVWGVETSLHALSAEQKRVVTAYFQAVDENRWEEAEAWVARASLPRFSGYRAEVAAFLSGNESIAQSRSNQVADRAAEWEEMFLRATVEEDGVWVVQAEFPTAVKLSCEMMEVDGAWRVIHR